MLQLDYLSFDVSGLEARVSYHAVFMYVGNPVEYADTSTLFTNPAQKQTEDYITGRYG